MLGKVLKNQQEQLEKLAADKLKVDEKLRQQQQRLAALTSLSQSLSQSTSQSAFYHHNRVALSGQISRLLAGQQQDTELAELDVQRRQKVLMQQFGRVKGLEKLQHKQLLLAQRQEQRKEQKQLDEWLSARHHSRKMTGR